MAWVHVAVVKASGRCGDRPRIATLLFLTLEHERKVMCMMPISLREHSANRRAGLGETVSHGLPCLRCASALYRSSSGREVRAPMWRQVSCVGARRCRRVIAFGQGGFAWSGVSASSRIRRVRMERHEGAFMLLLRCLHCEQGGFST